MVIKGEEVENPDIEQLLIQHSKQSFLGVTYEIKSHDKSKDNMSNLICIKMVDDY